MHRGYTFKAPLPADFRETSHICIVMNKDYNDDDIVYVYMTSQDEYIKKHYDIIDPEGYIELMPNEVQQYFPNNSRTTYIKCGLGDIRQIKKDVFEDKIKQNIFDGSVLNISIDILNRIEYAVMDSVTYSPNSYEIYSKIV